VTCVVVDARGEKRQQKEAVVAAGDETQWGVLL
jgi:hypothetical protein